MVTKDCLITGSKVGHHLAIRVIFQQRFCKQEKDLVIICLLKDGSTGALSPLFLHWKG
jgi:hypothetical protein